MSGKRYTEEFKIEAVKQSTDRGYKVGEVAKRLRVTAKSLHDWVERYCDTSVQHQTITDQQDELRRLKAQLRRVTEERDILKEAAVDSMGHRNRCFRILICGGLLDETYIYRRRAELCF